MSTKSPTPTKTHNHNHALPTISDTKTSPVNPPPRSTSTPSPTEFTINSQNESRDSIGQFTLLLPTLLKKISSILDFIMTVVSLAGLLEMSGSSFISCSQSHNRMALSQSDFVTQNCLMNDEIFLRLLVQFFIVFELLIQVQKFLYSLVDVDTDLDLPEDSEDLIIGGINLVAEDIDTTDKKFKKIIESLNTYYRSDRHRMFHNKFRSTLFAFILGFNLLWYAYLQKEFKPFLEGSFDVNMLVDYQYGKYQLLSECSVDLTSIINVLPSGITADNSLFPEYASEQVKMTCIRMMLPFMILAYTIRRAVAFLQIIAVVLNEIIMSRIRSRMRPKVECNILLSLASSISTDKEPNLGVKVTTETYEWETDDNEKISLGKIISVKVDSVPQPSLILPLRCETGTLEGGSNQFRLALVDGLDEEDESIDEEDESIDEEELTTSSS